MGFERLETRKIPCQISLNERQMRFVKDEAHRQRNTVQDVVRRILDNYIDERERKENLRAVDFRA